MIENLALAARLSQEPKLEVRNTTLETCSVHKSPLHDGFTPFEHAMVRNLSLQ